MAGTKDILGGAAIVGLGAAAVYFSDKIGSDDKKEDQSDDKCSTLQPEFQGSKAKISDGSASMRAQAMAYYACKYNEAIKYNASVQFKIGILQFLASLFLAYKQYETARQLQDRLDEVWHDLKDKGQHLYDHWDDNARPIEIGMLNEARARERAGYPVDYQTAINRSVATARREYSRARQKVRRETNVHCVGASRVALRQLYAAEARAVVLATNSAVRFEEQRKHDWEKGYRDEVYKLLGLFQNRIGQGLQTISAATGVMTAQANINPWEGFSQSMAQLSNLGNMYSTSNMAGFNVASSNLQSSLVTNHF